MNPEYIVFPLLKLHDGKKNSGICYFLNHDESGFYGPILAIAELDQDVLTCYLSGTGFMRWPGGG
jgi:hypothetical protein